MSDDAVPVGAQRGYVLASVAIVVVGLALGEVARQHTAAKLAPELTVSPFAVLYVLAQGVERVVEMIVNLLGKVSRFEFAERRKRLALQGLQRGEPARDQPDINQARRDLAVLSQALSFAVAYIAVSYFRCGMLTLVGVTGIQVWVDVLLTSVAVTGGSKGLHDLIAKVEKSKEKSEVQAARTTP